MSNKPVTDALKGILADTYSLQLKTQNYHWNVEGGLFRSLHLMFEEQYNELFAAVDVVAERIRALGEKAPGSYSEFAKLTKIKEAKAEADDFEMVKDLHQSNLQLSENLKKALEKAEKADDAATADLFTQRIAVHDKAAWMLRSVLAPEQRKKLVA
ncbi:MAG: DNA starvation/stationary phase protection protein [Azospirillum brasilense]|nr:MAG: DNA starvation/stationary phase protection protein [Azospirillum brasilense]